MAIPTAAYLVRPFLDDLISSISKTISSIFLPPPPSTADPSLLLSLQVIVLGILVLGWGFATLIYFILRRRNIIPSLFASSSPDFVRPRARPATFGFGSFFSGGSPMGSAGGGGAGRAGIVGGGAPWQQFTQEWKPVLGEIPKLEERVLEAEGEWKVSSTSIPLLLHFCPLSDLCCLSAPQRPTPILTQSPTILDPLLPHRSPSSTPFPQPQFRILPHRP